MPLYLDLLGFLTYIIFFSVNKRGTSAVQKTISSVHLNKEGKVVKINGGKLTNYMSSDFCLGLGYDWLQCKLYSLQPRLGSIFALHQTDANNFSTHLEWCFLVSYIVCMFLENSQVC